jgi:WD40 repeat protein
LSGDITYHDINNPNKPKRIVRGHNKNITALAYDSASKRMFSGSYDGLIVSWEAESGNTDALNGKGHTNQVNTLWVQGDNLVSCSMDDTVRITPLKTRQYSSDGIKLDSCPSNIAVGQRDKSLIIATVVDSIVIIKDGKVANKLPVKYQPMYVAISVDETQIAVGGKDNNIHLYSLSGAKLTDGPVLSGHRGPLTCLAFSPDGQHLASSDHNRDIFVWDVKKKEIKVQGWVYHSAAVKSLAWAPDSIHLVSGALDSNIIVWDIQQPTKRIFVKDAHRGGVTTVLFLDANTVASTGQDCTIKTWTVAFH